MLAESQAQLLKSSSKSSGSKSSKESKRAAASKAGSGDAALGTSTAGEEGGAGSSYTAKYRMTEEERVVVRTRTVMLAERTHRNGMTRSPSEQRAADKTIMDACMKVVRGSPLDREVLRLNARVLSDILSSDALDTAADRAARVEARAYMVSQGYVELWSAATRHCGVKKFSGRVGLLSPLHVLCHTAQAPYAAASPAIMRGMREGGAIDAVVDLLRDSSATADPLVFLHATAAMHVLINPERSSPDAKTPPTNENIEAALASGAVEALVAGLPMLTQKDPASLRATRSQTIANAALPTHIRASLQVLRVFALLLQANPDATRRALSGGLLPAVTSLLGQLIVPFAILFPHEAHSLLNLAHLSLDLAGTLLAHDKQGPDAPRLARVESFAGILVHVCRAFPTNTDLQRVCATQIRRVLSSHAERTAAQPALDGLAMEGVYRAFESVRSEPALAATLARA
jgi:hypothetical protein